MSDMSRKEAIENLEWLKVFLDTNGVFTVSDAIKKSIDFAIASLETDEAYQLEYEQRELCEDCISRNAVMDMIIEYRDSLTDIGMKYALERAYGVNYVGMKIADMPSVLPKADKPTIIDWNNCHTPEQLDSIATTKNNLGVDCVSKEEVIRKILDTVLWTRNASDDNKNILTNSLVKALEQEPQTFKWCTDCKEYDQEKHCCHRYSKVIRDTVEEMKQEPKSEWEYDHAILKAYFDGANEVLDKIRAEIEQGYCEVNNDYDHGRNYGLYMATQIIDKYKAENEG